MLGGRITVIFGENSYERASEVSKIKALATKSNFEIENLKVENLNFMDFLTAISGISLFSEKRLVILRSVSENADVWNRINEAISQISSDVHLCLIEEKIDKRSVIYKELSKIAEMKEMKALTSKDSKNLSEFARKIGKKFGFSMDHKTADFLISWVGTDEWKIRNSVERLALCNDVSIDKIREIIPQTIEGNAFEVFETALRGNFEGVILQISKLRISEGIEGAYPFLGLISSQFFNLTALRVGKKSGKSTADIAKEIGANAWALGKMEIFDKSLREDDFLKIAKLFAKTDENIKSTSANAWDLIENLLLEIAEISL